MARVLVVDDDASIQELIDTLLRFEGHDVARASNGREALDYITAPGSQMPDLIVLDLAMPEMSGWRFLEEMYARGLRKSTRVVIVTGSWDAEQPQGTGGPVRILAKPFDTDLLLQVIDDALSQDAAEMYEKSERTAELAKLLSRIDQVVGNDR